MKIGLYIFTVFFFITQGSSFADSRQNNTEYMDVRSDDSVEVDGYYFKSMTEYIRSDYFKIKNGKCRNQELTESFFTTEDDLSDCSTSLTVIRNEYWPADINYEIPIVFHIIYKEDGTGNISDEITISQVDILNEDYGALSGTPGSFGFDTHIRFKLAGITRTANDKWFKDIQERKYKDALGWDQTKYLNVYINSASDYLGYSYFPQTSAGEILDGVVALYSSVGRDSELVPYDQGRTITHEIGHYLGLFHTFQDGFEVGYDAGDRIEDTNPEETTHFDCIKTDSCDPYFEDPIHNYMDYSDDLCMNNFTAEQGNRMVCCLLTYRPFLYSIIYTD